MSSQHTSTEAEVPKNRGATDAKQPKALPPNPIPLPLTPCKGTDFLTYNAVLYKPILLYHFQRLG